MILVIHSFDVLFFFLLFRYGIMLTAIICTALQISCRVRYVQLQYSYSTVQQHSTMQCSPVPSRPAQPSPVQARKKERKQRKKDSINEMKWHCVVFVVNPWTDQDPFFFIQVIEIRLVNFPKSGTLDNHKKNYHLRPMSENMR